MDLPRIDILIHLLSALAAGAAIGMERTFHGRPAGFRTHALVCLASSVLMLVTVYQPRWFPLPASDAVRMDPTRMAQGIVTGIGFLGGGVIFKEGLTVRGLTTAASIWITSAIGILMGVGLYLPAVLATLLTLGVLTLFRRIETKVPVQFYAQHLVRFARASIMPESELRLLLAGHGFKVAKLSYRLTGDGRFFEYRMVIRTSNEANATRLAETLGALEAVREFAISPAGD